MRERETDKAPPSHTSRGDPRSIAAGLPPRIATYVGCEVIAGGLQLTFGSPQGVGVDRYTLCQLHLHFIFAQFDNVSPILGIPSRPLLNVSLEVNNQHYYFDKKDLI